VSRTIPLASVRGTLGDPKVGISPRTAAALAAGWAAPKYADDLRERAEDVLGEGGGEVVDEGLRVLDNLLGGARRERKKDAGSAGGGADASAAGAAEAPAAGAADAPAAGAEPAPEAGAASASGASAAESGSPQEASPTPE
jgi:hypothetical protein